MYVRSPAVAGQFYPSSQAQLRAFMKEHVVAQQPPSDAYAVVMPHAGYVYSGKTAAKTIAQVSITDTVLLIGPNHTGYGASFSVMTEGVWRTPLGDVAIDTELARGIRDASEYIEDDLLAHQQEHSLEVEIPFLQYRQPGVKIVPLTIGTDDLSVVREVAGAIADCLPARGKILIVVSSDMTHYESHESASRKDKEAINAILKLDEEALAHAVRRHRITMCGFVPTYLMLIAAKTLGATKATLVEYCTSGETSGDYEHVVGYAGIVIQ